MKTQLQSWFKRPAWTQLNWAKSKPKVINERYEGLSKTLRPVVDTSPSVSLRLKALSLITLPILMLSCSEKQTEQMQEKYVHDVSTFKDTIVDLPPAWSFGVLWGGYTLQDETLSRIDSIIAMDLPIDAYHIDSWFWDGLNKGAGPDGYLDFVGDTVAYPDMKGMWDYMESQHVKSGIWVWNMMHETGNEEHYNMLDSMGWHVRKIEKNTKGWHNKGKSVFDPVKGEYFKDSKTLYADFTNPDCYKYYQDNFKHFFDKGLDYVKLDNHTHVPYMDVFYKMTQNFGKETKGRGYIMTHAYHNDEEQMANFKKYPVKWSDDTEIAWKDTEEGVWPHGGLIDNVEGVTRPDGKVNDVPFFTIDAGGFNYSKKFMSSEVVGEQSNDFGGGLLNAKLMIPIDTELYIRWMQFANFLPVMQVFCGSEVPTSHLPWRNGPIAMANFKELTHLRMQLFPYIYSYAHQCRVRGGTMIKSDSNYIHQYLFGDELLIAPVVVQSATTKEVHLPAGQWIDYWTGKKYDGDQNIVVDAPLTTIPVFVKAGSIIPMRPYNKDIETGSRENLILDVYPSTETSEFELFEDDGISKDYKKGIFALTTISCSPEENGYKITVNPVKGYYEGMIDSKKVEVRFNTDKEPKVVEGSDAKWDFDSGNGILKIEFDLQVAEGADVSIQY